MPNTLVALVSVGTTLACFAIGWLIGRKMRNKNHHGTLTLDTMDKSAYASFDCDLDSLEDGSYILLKVHKV